MGGVESLLFGVLVFVAGSIVLGTGWAVIDTKLAVQAAAREAARAWVESDGSDAAWGVAMSRAREAFAGHGRKADALEVKQPVPAADIRRCAPVTIEARASIRVPAVPLIGRAARHVTVVGRHTEVVDPYRSGLPRGPGCGR